jgi:Tol biopolymer transport system component
MITRWMRVLTLVGLLAACASRPSTTLVGGRQVVLDGPGTLTAETDPQRCLALSQPSPAGALQTDLRSPDGAWAIRWASPTDHTQGRGNGLVLTTTASGRQQVVPVPQVGEPVGALQWSPDSAHIAILQPTLSPGAKVFYSGQIFVLSLQDLTVREVATYAGTTWGLAWAPDSQRLAYVGGAAWDRQYPSFVWIVDMTDGHAPRRLSEGCLPEWIS